jgi:hypothetical protein
MIDLNLTKKLPLLSHEIILRCSCTTESPYSFNHFAIFHPLEFKPDLLTVYQACQFCMVRIKC